MLNEPNKDLISSNAFLHDEIEDLALSQVNDFHGSYATLQFSKGTGVLNTPTLEKPNPFLCRVDSQPPNDITSLLKDTEFDLFPERFESESQSALDEFQLTQDVEQEFNETSNDQVPQLGNVSEQYADLAINQLPTRSQPQSQYELDQAVLENVYNFIRINGVSMTMNTQPPAYYHSRYASDGKRHVANSRREPTAVNLSNLNGCPTNNNVSVGIQVTKVTTTNNPKQQNLLHENKLECHEDNAHQNGHASVRVRLTNENILEGVKKFPHLSIILTKRDDYKFDIIPFGTVTMDQPYEKYTIPHGRNNSNAAKAKQFIKDYDLLAYQLVFQLMIIQNETWHTTDISCSTDIVREKGKQYNGPKKRKISEADDTEVLEDNDADTVTLSPPEKRQKRSPSPMNVGLPVTYVNNKNIHSTE